MASNEPSTSPNEPHLSPEQIADIDAALTKFKNALPLPKGDPGRRAAAQLMRRVGFQVSAILSLSGNRWGKSTIKTYVAGVRVDSNAPVPRVIEFIGKALDQNVTIEAILDFVETKTLLVPYKITIKDLAEILNMLRRENVLPEDFVNNYKGMVNQQLTPANLKTALEYKKALEDKGFGLHSLNAISATVKAFGESPESVLEALAKYGEIKKLEATLQDLQIKQTDASAQLGKLQEESQKSKDQLTKLNAEIESAQTTLQSLEETGKLGYNRQALQNLAAATVNLGGVTTVLTAIKEYKRLTDLQAEIQKIEERKTRLEKEKTEMETRNLHLKGHMDTVHALIEEPHKLTLDALESLVRIAKKYGPSESIFKAFEEYDTLQQLKDEKHNLEQKITETKDELQHLQDQEKTVRKKIDEFIPQLDSEMKILTDAFEKKFKDTLASEETSMKDKFTETRESINTTHNEVMEAFKQLTDQVTAELKSVLDAAHEIDNAYEQRERKADEIKAFVELLSLVEDPNSVTNARVVATTQLILSRFGIWLKANGTRFGPTGLLYVSPNSVADTCQNLAKNLGTLSKVLKDESAG